MRAMYQVNEIFYSLQGEGGRAGQPSVFVRFSGCNLRCDIQEGEKSPGGFACDTEFESGRGMTKEAILEECYRLAGGEAKWIVFSGGEPGLQLTPELCDLARLKNWMLAIETNGTINLDHLKLDWITLSPKVAEHAVKQLVATELKYVRGYGQGIPKPRAVAALKWISPAFDGPRINQRTLEWCIELVKLNPTWSLSMQQHKFWQVR